MPAESPLRAWRPPAFDLIETFRFEPGRGFVRLERHLGRMAASAEALGFAFDEAAARSLFASIEEKSSGSISPTPDPSPQGGGVGGGGHSAIALKGERCPPDTQSRSPLRIRLALKPDGSFDLATQPFAPLPAETVWRVALAKTRLSSTDPLLRHKTSRRESYDAARAEQKPEAADEMLLLNEKSEVCEGTITTLFVPAPDGSLLTPPLACGLLAGVLRAELVEEGRARESVVTPDYLRKAGRFFVGNSLRGLIPARLVSGS